MAPVVAFVFDTSCESCAVREARSCIVFAPCTRRLSNIGSLRASSCVTLLVLTSAGAKYCSERLACGAFPWIAAASPRMKPRSPVRVFGLSVSKSWSRLTSECV